MNTLVTLFVLLGIWKFFRMFNSRVRTPMLGSWDLRFEEITYTYKCKLASLKSVQDWSSTEPFLLFIIKTLCAKSRLALLRQAFQ